MTGAMRLSRTISRRFFRYYGANATSRKDSRPYLNAEDDSASFETSVTRSPGTDHVRRRPYNRPLFGWDGNQHCGHCHECRGLEASYFHWLFVFSGRRLCGRLAGIAWPEIKSVSPSITAIVKQIATHPVSWFVIIILGMGAATFIPKRSLQNDVARQRSKQTISVKLPKEWFSHQDAIAQFADKELLDKKEKASKAFDLACEHHTTVSNEMMETPFGLDKNMETLKKIEEDRDNEYANYMNLLNICLDNIQDKLRKGILVAKGFRSPHSLGNPMVLIPQDEWFILQLDFDNGIAKRLSSQNSFFDNGYIGIVIGKVV
jgi:hypothetical protein